MDNNKLVVIVDDRGIRSEPAPEDMGLEYLYSKVCKDTPDNRIVECCAGRFPDHDNIDIWVHEEGRLIPLPVFAKMRLTGEDFCGPILVCSSVETEDGLEAGPLTAEQVEVVVRSLEVLEKPYLPPALY